MSGERALLNSVFGRAAAAVLAATVALVLSPVSGGDPGIRCRGRDQPARTTPAAVPPARWGRATVASIPSAAASARTTRAARSSSPPTPARTSWRARSCRSTSRSVGPATVTSAFRPSTRARARPPDSRNTTFSAVDKPVIFWTPDTGAHVVRGAINAAWDKLGGSAGPLGVPTEDEVFKGDLVSQKFTGGELTWNRSSQGVHHRSARIWRGSWPG